MECKTGEFRNDIDKYARLAKRLNLDKGHCVTELDEKQIRGFNSMYGLTFANVTNLLDHARKVIA